MAGSLTIVGMGLIGTSFARALRALPDCGGFERILGIEPNPDHAGWLQRAADGADKLIDAIVTEVPADCRAVLLACPSDRIAGWVARLADHAATVFDAGSVKGAVLDEVAEQLGQVPANYVPAHPIAGAERSGPDASDAELFSDRLVILTPVAATDQQRIDLVRDLWTRIGARVEQLDPVRHDAIYALTSHLPHLLAFVYLNGVDADVLEHTGGGFRDFSRIGGSDPDMWSAIFDKNRAALLPALDVFERNLARFRAAVEAGDSARVKALIEAARQVQRASLT